MAKTAEEKQISRIKEYKSLFESPAGKRILGDLIKAHHVLGSCFVKGDPYESALREGERNVVLRILAILKIDPMELQKHIENQKEESYV